MTMCEVHEIQMPGCQQSALSQLLPSMTSSRATAQSACFGAWSLGSFQQALVGPLHSQSLGKLKQVWGRAWLTQSGTSLDADL